MNEKTQYTNPDISDVQQLVYMCCMLVVSPRHRFSWSKSFVDMLKEVYDMASQHEVVAENLTGTVSQNLTGLITEIKTDRKKVGPQCTDVSDFYFLALI